VVFDEEENTLYEPVTLDEIKDVLSLFKRDKSPGLMAGQWNSLQLFLIWLAKTLFR
jgi:hypothetical protein